MGRTLTFITLPVLALVAGGAIQLGRPIPPVQLQVAASPPNLPGAFSVAFPKQGQVAVGEVSLGLVAETPNQEPVAIASLTKMMTAYLLLQARPLKQGEDGPTSTITAAHVQEYQKAKADGDSVVRVAVGEKLTERQLLEALLLPSAGNIATLIATELEGSEANFVKKMNLAAQALGMSKTTYADVAGVSPATVSTAKDQLRMAQAVMKDGVFREIVNQPQAELPVVGIVYNVNFMVGKQGISGIKTGSTLAAGSCFVGSYPITVDGTPRILLGAVLGQRSLHDAITYDTTMFHAVAPQFKVYPLSAPSEGFAHLTTPWGQQSRLDLPKPLQLFGYAGMPINVTAKLGQGSLPFEAGQTLATLTVTTGDFIQTADLRSSQAIQEPGLVWRLHR